MVVKVCGTIYTCPHWWSLEIERGIFHLPLSIAGTIGGRVEKRIMMRFMNEWKLNTIMPDRKTIIWPWFDWYVCHPVLVVAMKVSYVSTAVWVCHRAVKTLLTNIHVTLGKWNAATISESIWTVSWLLIQFPVSWSSDTPAPGLTFFNKGSCNSHWIVSSSMTPLQSV